MRASSRCKQCCGCETQVLRIWRTAVARGWGGSKIGGVRWQYNHEAEKRGTRAYAPHQSHSALSRAASIVGILLLVSHTHLTVKKRR
eukprot:260158-Amphidinium_carterae.1